MPTPIDHAGILLPLLSCLTDESGGVEFNFTYPDDKYHAVWVELGRFRTFPYETLRNLLAYALRTGSKISFSPNTRRRVDTRKDKYGLPWDGFASKEDIIECSSSFVDADRKAGPVDLRELIAFTPQPTTIVQSSHVGKYHAYWSFKHSLPLETYEDLLKYEAVNRGLCNALELDVPMDVRRIMRLPGSMNTKYDPPVMCRVVYYNPDNLYTDFDQFPMAELGGSGSGNASAFNEYIVVYGCLTPAQYASAVEQLHHPQKFGGRNNCIYAVAKWMAELGLAQSDCEQMFAEVLGGRSEYRGISDKDRNSAIRSAYR